MVGAAYYSYLNKDKLVALTRGEKKESPTIPEEPTSPPKRKTNRIFCN